jgi:hypothetical protein
LITIAFLTTTTSCSKVFCFLNKMLPTIAILKKPTEMQMALSTQVKESVQLATKHLRDALAFASRSEHSMTVSTLADLLVRCESLECMDEMMNKFAGPSRTTGNMPSQRGDDTLF